MTTQGRGLIAVAIGIALALAACGDDGGGDSVTSGETTGETTGVTTGDVTNDDGTVDECALLTDAEAEELMGVEPYAPGAPDNEACSWGTDPYDRETIAYVVLEVSSLDDLLGTEYADYPTYLDETTNVGTEPLDGVGDEAYIVQPPIGGLGIDAIVGDQVVSLAVQPVENYDADSPEFEREVEIMQEIVGRL